MWHVSDMFVRVRERGRFTHKQCLADRKDSWDVTWTDRTHLGNHGIPDCTTTQPTNPLTAAKQHKDEYRVEGRLECMESEAHLSG